MSLGRRHFGEPPAACNSGCDACASGGCDAGGPSGGGGGAYSLAMRDVSAEGRGVLEALAAIPASDKRATLIQLVTRWRALQVRA